MRLLQLATLAALAGLWSNCSGNTAGGLMDVPMPDADLSGGTVSPDGTAYPTTNIGGRPRTATQAGQIFPNLTLEGVRSAATMDTPAVVSMAEYYDPAGARYDLLHVIGIFMWCPHCNNETVNLSKIAAWQADHRVAVVQIAMLGYGNASPTWSELQKWVGDHNLGFPVLVDGQGAQLGQYFSVNYVPVNIVVNPRTMEVLAADVGEVSDDQAYEQGFLDALKKGP
jgi:hypothetical protein